MNGHKTKITVRNESGLPVSEIDPDVYQEETEFSLKMSSSVDGFPTANIEVNLVKQFSGFNIIDKHFNVDVNFNSQSLSHEQTLFSGTYLQKEISFSKEKGYGSVKIKFVHSFFKVTMFGLKKRHFQQVKFLDFLQEIMTEAKVLSKVKNPEVIETVLIDGFTSEVNLFRLIKEVCFRNGLVMIFNPDDTIRFERREKIRADHLSAVPIQITEKDIISFTGKEGL